MNTVQKIKRMATVLGRVMAQGGNDITVTVSGTTAFRRPGQINIPMGDFTDPDVVVMTRGYIDHEIGHEKHTKHEVFVTAHAKSALHKHLLNIIEDARMERAVQDEFIGAKKNLAALARLAMERELFSEPDDQYPVVALLQSFCLYHGRAVVIGHDFLRPYAAKAEQLLAQSLGDELMAKIKAEVESTLHAKNTADAYKIATNIIALIQDELDKQQPQDEPDQSNEPDSGDDSGDAGGNDDSSDSSQDDSSSKQSDDNADTDDGGDDEGNEGANANSDPDSDPSETGDDSGDGDGDADADTDADSPGSGGDGDDTDENDDGDADADAAAGSDSDSDSDSQSLNGNQGSPSSNDQKTGQGAGDELVEALKELLGAADEDGLDDFHSAIAEMLEQAATDAKESLDDVWDVRPLPTAKAILSNEPVDLARAKSIGKRVYRKMDRVLIDERPTADLYRSQGRKISHRRLSGVAAGQDRIFIRKQDQKDTSAAISFAIDASASMRERMPLANNVAFALCHGLGQSGIATELSYYNALSDMRGDTTFFAKEFDRPLSSSNFRVRPSGSTPTGEAMVSMLIRLAARPERNKMLFVVTDGESNDANAVKKARELADKLGVKVIPIGLEAPFFDGFSKEDFVSIQALEELPVAVNHAIKAKLFA